MTWTQPLCRACWDKERPHDQPNPHLNPRPERCCMCHEWTSDGIYAIYNPSGVPYPTEED